MGRGVSSGGGRSSLGYLFGSGEAPKSAINNSQAIPTEAPAASKSAPEPASQPVDITNQIPADINSTSTNNYPRADDQNTDNFIKDRASTKVHAASGGGSSLGSQFCGGPGGGKRDFALNIYLDNGEYCLLIFVEAVDSG